MLQHQSAARVHSINFQKSTRKSTRSHLVVWVTMLATMLLGSASAQADGTKKSQPETRYPVRVTIREVRNRIIEGTVRNHKLYADQPKEFGADDTAPTPPETLAFALGSCVVSTGRLLAMQKDLKISNLSAVVEGDLDFARALGISKTSRAGFRRLTINVDVDADMTNEEKAKFLREVFARCPMCDNLANVTPVSILRE